jgi:hypothetical protein
VQVTLTVALLNQAISHWPLTEENMFDPKSVYVRFLVDKAAVGAVFLRVLRSSPVIIIPPVLHTHLHLHTALTSKKKGRSQGTFQKAMLFASRGEYMENYFHFFFFRFQRAAFWHSFTMNHVL